MKEAAKKVEDSVEETLICSDFPYGHWTWIRTNNVIERLNRVVADRCTGIYVREEDIFSAIYYQLNLFAKANSSFNANYYAKKDELGLKVAHYREMLADHMECTMKLYEQLIQKELDNDAYLAEKAKVYTAKELLEKDEAGLDVNKRRHK